MTLSTNRELHHVVRRDQGWSQGTRHDEAIGIGWVARANVSETVENAKVGEDTAADYNVFDQRGINARNRAGSRSLRCA